MQKSDVQAGILSAWKTVSDLELGETISSPAPLLVNSEFRDLILQVEVPYVQIYKLGLKLSHYNFLLTDYSYFQFSWFSVGCVRYAYYPNPFITGREALGDVQSAQLWTKELNEGAIDIEDYLSLLQGFSPEPRVPLIRYENAPSDYVTLKHPCSHFHIGHHSDNRWPANRLLTPTAFALLICKLYYSTYWNIHWTEKPDGKKFNQFEDRLAKEKNKSVVLAQQYFAPIEKDSFHLA